MELSAPEYEQGPFSELYDEWHLAGKRSRKRREIEQQLRASYQEAWDSGLPHEQAGVLYFLYDVRAVEQAELVLAGLRSPHFGVQDVAAVLTCAWLSRAIELPATTLDDFRALCLRQPYLNTFRIASDLARDDGWPADRPFVQLIEKWSLTEFGSSDRAEVENQLSASSLKAWETGDATDGAFVLDFESRPTEGSPPPWVPGAIIEGIRSDDYTLARSAIVAAEALVRRGVGFGVEFEGLVENHVRRFPDSYAIAVGIRMHLEGKGPLRARPPKG